ncbi:MAG: hypothetical protein EOO45_13680 [Flavobacterium sp.]|nr:MAG: hypothetical protein EOO45_13680 [Flavobacterium sp.]
MKKLLLLSEYYKSTLPVNLGFSVIGLMQGAEMFLTLFSTIGLFAAILLKEVVRKNQYYFYYNNGLNKVQLISFCLITNVLISIFITVLL